MTIEIEAGTSQRQCSMKLWIAHALFGGQPWWKLSRTDQDLSPWLPFHDDDSSLQPMRTSVARMGRPSKLGLLVGKRRPADTAPQTRTTVRTGLPGIRPAWLSP
jgi:hypothetical protein